MEYKNTDNLSKFLASQLPLITTQLLLSVSILSLVFSYLSLWPSPLYYYEKLNYFSSESFLNKNCVFLICNGLVFFLAKTSALVPRRSSSYADMLQKRVGDGQETEVEVQPLSEKHIMSEESDHEPTQGLQEDENEANEEEEEFECSEEGGAYYEEEQVENDQSGSKICWLSDDDDEELHGDEEHEEEEEEDEENDKLSVEELNHKFEDFILRMKKEIRINEPTQHQQLMIMAT